VIGGGSKYVRDCLNGVLARGDEVVFFSNRGALSSVELRQLVRPIDLKPVYVFERSQSLASWLGHGRFAALVRKSLVVMNPVLFLLNVLEIWRRLISVRPEVMIACNGGYPGSEATLAAVLAARLRRVPTVLIVMSTPQPRRFILPGYDWLLDRFVLAVADRVVLNSSVQARLLVQLRGIPADRLHILYNGIANACSQRKWQPLTRSEIVLGVVCRIDPLKGLDHLIRALALLPAQFTLRIVGDGESRETLQLLAQALGIGERVVFVGFIQDIDMHNELDSFDIYVFPSLMEGLPYSLLEAMRAGLPIVSTNVGGIPEALRDGKEGLLVPPGSSQALADAINIMLYDKEQARRFGADARQRYEELFSLDKMQSSFIEIVNEVESKKNERNTQI